jgi:hypothetical protein
MFYEQVCDCMLIAAKRNPRGSNNKYAQWRGFVIANLSSQHYTIYYRAPYAQKYI